MKILNACHVDYDLRTDVRKQRDTLNPDEVAWLNSQQGQREFSVVPGLIGWTPYNTTVFFGADTYHAFVIDEPEISPDADDSAFWDATRTFTVGDVRKIREQTETSLRESVEAQTRTNATGNRYPLINLACVFVTCPVCKTDLRSPSGEQHWTLDEEPGLGKPRPGPHRQDLPRQPLRPFRRDPRPLASRLLPGPAPSLRCDRLD